MSDKNDLLPCPFCGGKCDPSGWLRGDGIRGPECEQCGATASTVEDWNQRATISQRPAPAAVPDGYVLVTPEQLEKHTTTAWECPPQSLVVLVSSLKRLHDKNAAAPAPVAQEPVAWQARFTDPGQEWSTCSKEHHALVQANPREWPGYETRELYAHPPAAEQPDTALSMLGEDVMYWLRRFRDCREEDEDEHDLPETAILSLEALGALRSIGYEQHEITKFGDYLLGKENEA